MMQTKVGSGNQRVGASGAYARAQPWWQGYGNTDTNGLTSVGERGLRTSEENLNVVMVGSLNVNKDIPSGIALRPDGYNGQGNHTFNASQVTISEHPSENSQRELVGHSTVIAAYPYQDPTYGAIVPPFGQTPLAHPHLYGVHQTRMALPLEMEEEPVYVNAKQYNGIMRRRQIRAKAELEKKIIKNRKPYLHESRHQHAMRRARGCGGRFLNTKKLNNSMASKDSTQENETGSSNSNHSMMLRNNEYLYLTTESQAETTTRMTHNILSFGNNDIQMRSSAYHNQSMSGDDQEGYLKQRREQGMRMTGHSPRVFPIT